MRIMFAVQTLSNGGAERVVSELANALVELGHDVGVLLTRRELNEYPIDQRVEIFLLDAKYCSDKGSALTRTLHRIRMIRDTLKLYEPDILIPFLPGMVRDAFFASRGLKINFIGTLRNNPSGNKEKMYPLFQNYIFEHSSKVFLQTEAQYRFLSKKAQTKAFVVPNPVNKEVLLSGKDRVYQPHIKRLVTCGRLVEQKNHQMLLEAMKILHDKYPDIVLVIYGEGPEKGGLLKKIDSLEQKDYVKVLGRTNNIVNAFRESDMFVFSSDYEGMPNALMEAMAAGLPCISTDCPTGPRELLGDSDRGLLVPIGDAVYMANMMKDLIESPDKAIRFGKKAHLFICENYKSQDIAKRLIEHVKMK